MTSVAGWAGFPYVAPFALFILLLAVARPLAVLGVWQHPLWVAALVAVLWTCSREVVSFRIARPASTVLIGVGVFVVWIAPDAFLPGYRSHWLFQNAIFGKLESSIDAGLLRDPVVLVFRSVRAILLVPIIEELFWRAWLMRWLIRADFERVPLGAYSAQSFWVVAALFASEHGPYWDVGLLAGVAYNWWMVRTRSLGDVILAHAVTNACLCGWVILGGRWEYWL